jgi:NMD protein affecting ribosome stability and mRNA decay
MAKEICVVCGKETPYDFETHIDQRIDYVEGIGQLCGQCSRNDNSTISIPKSLVKKYPNDMELGEKVRDIYYNGI